MQCGAVKVISASVWWLWSWDFPVCVAYNVFYAPHKLLSPYLQLALFSPSLRTCNSWPFSLVNYLHVKQWIKMMALRKMLLILRKKKKKKHISSWNLLPEACLSFPPWEGDTFLFHTAAPFAQGNVFCLWFWNIPLIFWGWGERMSVWCFSGSGKPWKNAKEGVWNSPSCCRNPRLGEIAAELEMFKALKA